METGATFPISMDQKTLMKTKLEVESFNKSLLKNGRRIKNTLGKEDFLRLLIVQLKNQDPTKPLEDKEFIAQMAEFSSLEQMTEINSTLEKMKSQNRLSLAYSLLGKEVEVMDGESGELTSGIVEEVSFDATEPHIHFDGLSYGLSEVVRARIREES